MNQENRTKKGYILIGYHFVRKAKKPIGKMSFLYFSLHSSPNHFDPNSLILEETNYIPFFSFLTKSLNQKAQFYVVIFLMDLIQDSNI